MRAHAQIAIKNFTKFQHYKNRNPPWIKLYTALLEDYDFLALSDGARSQLLLIWLVAARMGGSVPDDPKWIAATIHCTGPLKLDELVASGFLIRIREHASGALTDCTRDASTDASTDASGPLAKVEHATTRDAREEGEGETEREAEAAIPPPRRPHPHRAAVSPDAAQRAALRELIPVRMHGDLDRALAESDRPATLVAELLGMATDAGGTGRTFTGAEIAQALHDLVANGDHRRFNARLVRRYLAGVDPPGRPNGTGHAAAGSSATTEAECAFDALLQLIRSTPGGWRQVTATALAALPPPMRAGLRAADGLRAVADADEFTLRAKRKQFTAAYLTAPQEQPA